jgi:hypothetical protein
MRRTKVLVEKRGDALFAGDVRVEFEPGSTWSSRGRWVRMRDNLTWETEEQLGISRRCYWLHSCMTCERLFLGAPTARCCSDECRAGAKRVAAVRQQERRAKRRAQDLARHGRCDSCGKPMPDRQRLHDYETRNNFCSGACRQKAYRERKREEAERQRRHEHYYGSDAPAPKP